ncbi:EpsG family protein [Chryseobacterium sp. SSA4.19]|uniref:EpsG family protein n=1 Tax=Chryseobacterium sp. SSA4.19 TaxID=2919915 RepID=UPI001F4DE1CB|nr:EpsG family protein [Chryseobacterium sp. SSA4.19]MCJ8152382.1 EpsG family protein [Chryseobacterium sp. SSA4.19]
MEPTFSYSYSTPYLILILLFFLLFLWENRVRKNDGSITMIRYVCMLLFVGFFGLRGYMDTDFVVYYPIYDSAPTLDDTSGVIRFFTHVTEDYLLKVEPGFKVFVVILKSISKDYFFLQFVSSLIDCIFLNYFFKKYSPQYVLGFIMFLIFSGLIIEFNLIRNSKTIFLFIYSLQFIKERNALKYFICNGIGLFFHSSAIFYFPLYFFLHKKIPHQFVWGAFIVGNVLYLGQIKFITPIVIALGNMVGGIYSLMAEAYSENKLYSTGYGITMGYIEKVLTFILFYRSYVKIGELIKDEKLLNIFFNLFFLFTVTYLFLSEYSILLDRMTTLFVMSYWILYPYVYAVLEKMFKMVFTFILLLFGLYKMYNSNNNIIRKYENILWDKPTITRAYYIINKHLDKILSPKK